ncbi:nucleotide-diphospho-sugar transferase [Ochromonadaceae sp. CCMP2298]|nr:nucleotide-diphospho-sugar transferase [Ochromonadaceae sp. CCMP2298]
MASLAEGDAVVAQLKAFGQEHVLEALPNLTPDHPIYKQLEALNIGQSLENFRSAQQGAGKGDISLSEYQPVKGVINIADKDSTSSKGYEATGLEAIAAGRVAAVIMSGGQGTRLGFAGPKGMYCLGMPSQKTVFQIHMEKVLKIRQLAGESGASGLPCVPVYIMTSDLNHSTIVDYFRAHSFFGYPPEDVIFFEQGLEPAFTFDGKIIVESATSLSLAPDGNGGIYRALLKGGCIDDMKARGVEHLHIYGIDNVLTKSLDPLFMGACIQQRAECGNKVVWRAHKAEKVGVTAELGGRMYVLEYSEIPPDLAETEDSAGKLLFGAANICNHYLSLQFLVGAVLPSLSSTYHVARKKIPYFDPVIQQTVTPAADNGVKIEMFIFDVFPLAAEWVVVEGLREEEFAPVKNTPGSAQDSPDTARELLSQQAQRWLLVAGAKINRDSGTGCVCEISPLLSYSGEGLSSFRDTEVSLPCYLH